MSQATSEISAKVAAIATQLATIARAETTNEKELNDIADALEAIADELATIDPALVIAQTPSSATDQQPPNTELVPVDPTLTPQG